jgi:tetratricopeptide (TPR) repeat protein
MKRVAVIVLLVAASLFGVLGWQAVVRERDYRRFIADGDRALATDQTFLAVEAYSYAILLRGDSMLAYLKRGEAYRRRGETGAALRDLRTATRLDPTAATPLEVLGDINATLDRFARAEESYQAYVRLDDRSPRVLYKLALTRHRLGRSQAAIAPLRQAIALDDRFAAAHYLLGLCLRTQDQPSEATVEFERAVRLEPGLMSAREELAELYEETRREKDAINQLEALAALEPAKPERQIALGLAYGRAGLVDLAVTTLVRVAEDHPEDPDVYVALGRVWLDTAEAHRDRGALIKALEALAVVSRRGQPGSDALLLLGRAQLLNGDAAEAERTLKLATSQFPIEPEALLRLSVVAERAGHLGTARDALIRHTALSGDGLPPPDRATHIADLSIRLNEPGVAVAWYAKAAANASAGAPALARLADAQMRAGDAVGALATIERGLAKDATNATLLQLQRRLKTAPAPRR